MLTSAQILKDANESKFEDIKSKLEGFVKPVYETSVGRSEAKHYGIFIQHCLKIFNSKITSIKDGSLLDEVISSTVVCGKCYLKLLSVLDEDRTFAVPTFLYLIIHSITDIKVLSEYLLDVSQIVLDIFEKATFPLPEKIHSVVYAFYSLLWKTSRILLQQGNSVSLKNVLEIRKSSLLFLCYLPWKEELVTQIHSIISHYSKYDKKWLDAGTTEAFYDVFVSIVDRLKLRISVEAETDITTFKCAILQIHGMLVEHLLKALDVTKAKEVILSITASATGSSPTSVMALFYDFSADVISSKKMNEKVNIDIKKLKEANKLAADIVEKENEKEVLVLYASLSYFIQLLVSKSLEGLTVDVFHELAESCVILRKVSKKLLLVYNKPQDAKKVEDVTDKKMRVALCSLIASYRQLQVLHLILEAKFDKESAVLTKCLDLAENYVHDIDESEQIITEKGINVQRCNLGFVCSNIGYICVQEGSYKAATTMYTIVVKQFYKCQQANLLSMYEKLVECYQHQEEWLEASECVVQALSTVDDSLKHVATMWARLKREAITKEESLIPVTLNALVEKRGVKIPNLTSRQILLAEYQAWKNFSRRHHLVEYFVLCEMLEVANTAIQKAEAMISIAMDSCITGQTYKERSASELLNDAIILLDKKLPGAETSLALACYTKYITAHEDSIEQIRSEYGEQDIYVTWNIQDDKRFTLQDEQSNLPFLVRAIELWEKSQKDEIVSPEVKKKKSTKKCFVGKEQKCDTDFVHEDSMFDLEHHVDCLIMCATRLLTMKQPQLAERALLVARQQLTKLGDNKRTADLTLCLTRALMSLNKYEEAESVINAKGDNKKQKPSVNTSLVMSELYMLVGKSDEGLGILQSLLDDENNKSKSVGYYLNQGTAKRLLSMGLCLPSAAQLITSTNQYLLSLAFEAVHCHVSVLNCLTKNGRLHRNADKWMMLNEILSSMLHLCQLCRFIGLPRDALCYLRAGLNISQGQGLPRWSCEFLFEMLSVQSMEADSEKALTTVEYLNCIISAENISKVTESQNQSTTEKKTENQSTDRLTSESHLDPNKITFPTVEDSDCFGFQSLGVTPMKLEAEQNEKTPERACSELELDSGRKRKMKQLEVPECVCMKQDVESCTDRYRHNLCIRAGVVLSDFLTQTGMKSAAQRLLDQVQSKFKLMTCIGIDNGENCGNEVALRNGSSTYNGFTGDPCLLYAYLEAVCVQAESYLHQRDFHKVHHIWKSLQKLEQTGCLKSVLHSNILLTRLALCDATGYTLSLHETRSEAILDINQSENVLVGADCGIGETTEQLGKQAASTRKKVSFGSESDILIVTGTKIKTSRKKLLKEEIENMPFVEQKNIALLSTPKVNFANKTQRVKKTPSTNKMAALERIMASDDESDKFTVLHDEEVLFPLPKPVTPRVGPKLKTSKSKVSSKCKTEPRNPQKKKPFNIAEDPEDDTKIACKLGDLFHSTVDDDEEISFPISKPTTPRPVPKSSKTAKSTSKLSSKCRTEPRKPRNAKSGSDLNNSTDKKDIGCKLDFTDEENDGSVDTEETSEVVEMVEKLALEDECKEVNDDATCEGQNKSKPKQKTKVSSNKSKIPKRTLKPSVKGKSNNSCSVADDSVYVFKESSVKSLNDRRKLLKEKTQKKNEIFVDCDIALVKANSNESDVFDFDLEASPCVAKVTKVGKGKSTQKGRKTKATAKKKVATNDGDEEVSDKENMNIAPVRRRTRGRQNAGEIETVRGIPDCFDEEMELDISLDDLLEVKSDSDSSLLQDSSNRNNGKLSESLIESSLDWFDENSDSMAGTSLEPKEIMRGDKKAKTTRNTRSRGNSRKGEITDNGGSNVNTGGTSEIDNVAENDFGNAVEKMRSGRKICLKNLTECLNSDDDPKLLPVERPRAGVGSPCEADIISTLELLYERLCQFPPNPQHSDTCHMLALHHLDTNPQRSAFLLSDAMAVTFRHQVMLKTDRKARKDAGMMGGSVGLGQHNQMFRKEDENLETSIQAIPEDWCVVQLSVVSAGSSWKQMILTRFVKNHAPVVLRLPGFSSPQGRYILKEFSSILEQGVETAKIDNISEWWSIRRKLDADMLNLVERMEKHWLGIWRCALLPGKCRPDVLTRAQKEIMKIIQTDVELSHIGLLLLAEKTISEKDLRLCVEQIVGSSVDNSDLDKSVTVLKKYSKCMVSHGDKQHTILILDKTVQHLPWEGMSILSERSVSRMPCLSHLVTQLSNLQSQKNSVFMQGVNSRHTFYILNPQSDLLRTEEFFKDWFESEEGWKGVTGVKPTSEQFIEALTERDFLIYCGHGSGGRFFNSHEIEKLSARAVALLMGCSSGRLQVKGQLEATGMMISYFLAGCPSMVANLWDVTDKDIDKFTAELLQKWFSACEGTYLSKEVQKARSVCKLKHLNGFAPVVYGLPVFINNGKS